jgi:hypothetical protein
MHGAARASGGDAAGGRRDGKQHVCCARSGCDEDGQKRCGGCKQVGAECISKLKYVSTFCPVSSFRCVYVWMDACPRPAWRPLGMAAQLLALSSLSCC